MSTPEKEWARIKINGKTKLVKRDLLTAQQKKALDSSPYGVVSVHVDPSIPVAVEPKTKEVYTECDCLGVDVSTELKVEDLESVEEKKKRIQEEIDRRMGSAMKDIKLSNEPPRLGPGDKSSEVKQIACLVHHLSEIKKQLGSSANQTIFKNSSQLAAQLLGISVSSVERKLAESREDTSEKGNVKAETKEEKVLKLLTDRQKEEIWNHVQECYKTDTNFTLASLLNDLKDKYGFQFKRSTLRKILHAMGIVYKQKTYNPMCSVRHDIIRWRERYLNTIAEYREKGAFITYYDETWIFHGMSRKYGWVLKEKHAYELARMGNLNNPIPGFRATSDKGTRAIVLAVLTENGMQSIDIVTSKRPKDEQLLDYHKYMTAATVKEYMSKALPAIAAAAPPGREPILVIDNASIHNTPLLKLPTKSSSKPVLSSFLESQGIAFDPKLTRDGLWEEAELYISAHGGRAAMMKYELDEMAKNYGVTIVRLPPYHCCLNPIELIWCQLKEFLRKFGKVDNNIDIVRQQAIEFLKNILPGTIANTIEHVIDIEPYLRLFSQQDSVEEEEEESNEESDDEEEDSDSEKQNIDFHDERYYTDFDV